MLLEEVMQQLEECGTEQTRKTYKNHGAKELYLELALRI